MTLTRAKAVLDDASTLINGPRQIDYGHPVRNFNDIATMWTMILRNRLAPNQSIGAPDVALMMAGLKLMRASQTITHDSLADGAAYFALAEEVNL